MELPSTETSGIIIWMNWLWLYWLTFIAAFYYEYINFFIANSIAGIVIHNYCITFEFQPKNFQTVACEFVVLVKPDTNYVIRYKDESVHSWKRKFISNWVNDICKNWLWQEMCILHRCKISYNKHVCSSLINFYLSVSYSKCSK